MFNNIMHEFYFRMKLHDDKNEIVIELMINKYDRPTFRCQSATKTDVASPIDPLLRTIYDKSSQLKEACSITRTTMFIM